MKLLEGLYLPRLDVTRVTKDVPRERVAEVVVASYICKGIKPPTGDIMGQAFSLALEANSDISKAIADPNLIWHEEIWPIHALRITGMRPPEDDQHRIGKIIQKHRKRFLGFAGELITIPAAIESDIGYTVQPDRDRLPLLALRGKLNNHIIDGHHRTTLAIWQKATTMKCLTAYKR